MRCVAHSDRRREVDDLVRPVNRGPLIAMKLRFETSRGERWQSSERPVTGQLIKASIVETIRLNSTHQCANII